MMYDLYLLTTPAESAAIGQAQPFIVNHTVVEVEDRADAVALAREWGWPVSRTRASRLTRW